MQTEIEKHETFLCTCDCKLKWFGYGEWVEEVDKVTFQYKDYDCMVHRVLSPEPFQKDIVFGGHLCGYVKIPAGHVYYQQRDTRDIHILCHGSITHNATNEDGLNSHWIGFDCAHSGDICPSVENCKRLNGYIENSYRKEMWGKHPHLKPTYKNILFCVQECMDIVDQLMEIQDEHNKKPNGSQKY